MRSLFTVYRRELRAYLVSPIPYVIAVLFTGYLAWQLFYGEDGTFFVNNQASLEWGFFNDVMPSVLVLLAAAIGMRLWSEEVRGGTLEHLMTLPVSGAALVVGKFLAAATILLGCLILTLPAPFSVASLGDLDWGPVMTGYLGAFLLGCSVLAMGSWISSLTRHQIVAFLLTLAAGFLLVFVQLLAGGNSDTVFDAISLGGHYDLMRRGVIDFRDLLYFGSLILFFVYLNVRTVENRRVR